MTAASPADMLAEALEHHTAGRLNQAEAKYRQLLSIVPDHADGLHLLGMVALQTQRLDLAVDLIGQAVAISPRSAAYHCSLGNALGAQGQPRKAVDCFRQAIALSPGMARAHHDLGIALARLGQREAAAAAFADAIAARPDYAEAHNHRGNALRELGRLNEAVACCRQAVALRPDYPEAHFNLGTVLGQQGNLAAAADSLRRALALRPDFADAHNNLGNILKQQGRPAQAAAHYAQAVALAPDDWLTFSNLLFCQNYFPDRTPKELRALAERFGAAVSAAARRYTDWAYPPSERPLRVGVVSADLRAHVVGYFLEALLRDADPARVTFVAFPTLAGDDARTAQLKQWCAEWRPIHGMDDAAAAALIHAAGVQVLLDLSGHTAHNRLGVFAWRPAPVQATWLGYFATTGVPAMDYIIADPYVAPPAENDHFTEAVWRLPEIYLCFTPPDPPVPVSGLPALANGTVTFGCFSNLTKVNDAVLALWSRVLEAVPASRLRLKASQLADSRFQAEIAERFAAAGIAPERLIIAPPSARGDYLRAYHDVDIMLDTFPYPGGTTSFEALWMGVPVLTRRGDRFLSHLGETVMTNAGLPDWVAADNDDYVSKAVRFSADLPGLARLRAGLRNQVLTSPLFDGPRFAGHFQTALEGMWSKFMFDTGLRLHQSGAAAEAERYYRHVLALAPRHADCLHLLAMLAQQAGRLQEAEASVRRAIAVSDITPQYHCTLGTVLALQTRLQEAIACFDRAIALNPAFPEALGNRGLALKQLGRPDEAEADRRRAILPRPEHGHTDMTAPARKD